MNPRTSLLSLLLLIAGVSAFAQALPARSSDALNGPLNLSQPAKAAATEPQKLLLQSATPADDSGNNRKEEEGSVQRLPYGVGFAHRQQGRACGGGGRGGRGR